jgi:hypothetical protein
VAKRVQTFSHAAAPSAEEAIDYVIDTGMTDGHAINEFLRAWRDGVWAEMFDDFPDFFDWLKTKRAR